MRRLGLILFGVTCFVGFAIAVTPARVVYDAALRPAGVEVGLVQGSVWSAQALRLRTGDQHIARADAALDPASLLSFNARFAVTLSDPGLRASGDAILHAGGARIEDVSGVMRLYRVLPELAAFAPEESVSFEISTLAFDAEGRCDVAEGRVASAALVTLGERYGAAMPLLEGDLFCAGDQLGLQISGASDSLSFDGRLRFAAGGLEGQIEARTTELPLIAALSFAGFDQVDQGVYVLTIPALEEG